MPTTIELLHQLPTTIITNPKIELTILDLLAFFIKECISATNEFYIKKNLKLFDPHVGDTACQVRAYIYLLFSVKNKEDHLFCQSKNTIEELELYYNSILQLKINLLNSNKNQGEFNNFKQKKLYQFLYENKLIFNISEKILILMMGHFLTRFKKIDFLGNTSIDYGKICKEINITKKMSKKIIHYYQIILSEYSVKFVRGIWSGLSECRHLGIIFDHFKFRDDDNRSVLPCYTVMKIILSHMIKSRTPILIIAVNQFDNTLEKINLFFVPYENSYRLQHLNCFKDKYTSSIVIQGTYNFPLHCIESKRKFIKFMSVGLIDILLANMAEHPQFSGKKLKNKSANPFSSFLYNNLSSNNNENLKQPNQDIHHIKTLENELNKMKSFAKKLYCNEKVFLFRINHIFCGGIAEQL